jgi:hypothetical protein
MHKKTETYKTEHELNGTCACGKVSVVAKIQSTAKNEVKLPLRHRQKENKKIYHRTVGLNV